MKRTLEFDEPPPTRTRRQIFNDLVAAQRTINAAFARINNDLREDIDGRLREDSDGPRHNFAELPANVLLAIMDRAPDSQYVTSRVALLWLSRRDARW